MDISKHIIEIREAKKIKQIEIAEKLSIDRQNYSRLEKRGEKLTIEQLKQIANALEVNVIELLGDSVFKDFTNTSNFVIEGLESELTEMKRLLSFYENAKISINNYYIQIAIEKLWSNDMTYKGKDIDEYRYEINYIVDVDDYINTFFIDEILSNDIGRFLANSGMITKESLKESFNTFKNWIPQKYKTV